MPILVPYVLLEDQFTGIFATPGSPLGFSTDQAVSLFASTSFLYSLGIMVSVVAAGVMYARAGVYRMQASESGVKKSNEEIKRTTLGLLGVLCLFVIIYTFNRDLLTGEVGLKGFEAKPSQSSPGAITAALPKTTPTVPAATNSTYAARVASHNANVARLAPSGIHTNYGDQPCTEVQFTETTPKCTSLAYLPEETIQLILKLNGSCGCTLVITGGTEPGHKSHGENRRPVDLRLAGPRGNPNNTDPLYTYVKSTAGNKLGSSTNCFEQYVLFGFTFCDEKPPNPQHFHVS